MSAIDEFAADVNGVIADIEAQFKTLQDTKAALKKQGNDLAFNWAAYFAAQKVAMQKAQDALNRLSNAPLSETSPPTVTNGALSSIPVVKP